MHSGIKNRVIALVTLQAPADTRILLHNSYVMPFLCKNSTTNKTAKPGTNDNDVLIRHSFQSYFSNYHK